MHNKKHYTTLNTLGKKVVEAFCTIKACVPLNMTAVFEEIEGGNYTTDNSGSLHAHWELSGKWTKSGHPEILNLTEDDFNYEQEY